MHLFEEKIDPEYGTAKIVVTKKGADLMTRLHREGKLKMKKGY